jgi:hypothetical protein
VTAYEFWLAGQEEARHTEDGHERDPQDREEEQ